MFFDSDSGPHLTHYRAYDPMTGRWLLRDPIGEAGGINAYAYVWGEPIGKIDRTGLQQTCLPGVRCVGDQDNPNLPGTPEDAEPRDYFECLKEHRCDIDDDNERSKCEDFVDNGCKSNPQNCCVLNEQLCLADAAFDEDFEAAKNRCKSEALMCALRHGGK